MALVVKNPPASAGDIKRCGFNPGLGRSPGGGRGNPLQYSCLENSMDRKAGGLWYLGSKRVGHDWSDLACVHILFVQSSVILLWLENSLGDWAWGYKWGDQLKQAGLLCPQPARVIFGKWCYFSGSNLPQLQKERRFLKWNPTLPFCSKTELLAFPKDAVHVHHWARPQGIFMQQMLLNAFRVSASEPTMVGTTAMLTTLSWRLHSRLKLRGWSEKVWLTTLSSGL